jgi:hypothetical protein
MKLGNVLTVTLVAFACIAVFGVALGQIQISGEEYQSNISYSFTRLSLMYDYSCDQNVYGLHVFLKNNGVKSVQNLEVAITNALCVGSIPPLATSLSQGQSIQFYLYTTVPNGTITVTGNNTDLFIHF